MIEYTRGNLLRADAEALVNTVNCVGAMGKGIALQFKQAFPENYGAYAKACKAKEVQPGRMFIHDTGSMVNPRYIINFPTKRHWRGQSRMEDVEAGLKALVSDVQRLGIASIAVPPLGCGYGGLRWAEVQSRIEAAFAELPEVTVLLYKPQGAPEPQARPVNTERPKLTPARALFIRLMQQYTELSYRLTQLEIQKLAYFMQEAGEPLRLQYTAGTYGPYADNLNKVLELLEGHFIQGYSGSRAPDVELKLLPGAVEEADAFLADFPESLSHFEKATAVIEGFETPYGMELLSSVHWVAKHTDTPAQSAEEAVHAIYEWNTRKANMFKSEHIRTAWDRLTELCWSRTFG
jgi:O-acetyl-ADP-ribose deacetylase (regulator of RNase III)